SRRRHCRLIRQTCRKWMSCIDYLQCSLCRRSLAKICCGGSRHSHVVKDIKLPDHYRHGHITELVGNAARCSSRRDDYDRLPVCICGDELVAGDLGSDSEAKIL